MHTLAGHTGAVFSIAFSPDRATLASGGEDYTVRLWDVPTGRQIQLLEGHSNAVPEVAFSPSGNILASSSYDGTVKLWSVATK